jgi:hypothetical protein
VDVQRARHVLQPFPTDGRTLARRSVTLLDREVAWLLHRAIYSQSRVDLFKSDWDPEEIARERTMGTYTPFDYIKSDEMDALIWCEGYAVWTVWSPAYSPIILGATRPPMAVIARDIMSLVEWLKDQGTRQARPTLDILNEFCARGSLLSIPNYAQLSRENVCASTGLLTDMFSIAVSAGRSEFGRDDLSILVDAVYEYLEFITYPGPDALWLGKRPLNPDKYKDLTGSLEDMTASFIYSGPFRFKLSTDPAEHLTLDNGKVLLFWEGKQFWTNEGETSLLFPGRGKFQKYKALTLGRYHCTLILLK